MLEEKILQNQDDKLHEYLHTIAHELRTPFASIQGFASLLDEKFKNNLPSEGQTYLARILANLRRVDGLLTDITRLAKISIDESRFEKVSVQSIIDRALDSHLIQLHKSKIQLQLEPDLPELTCDVETMVMVFSNLIGNAIKYSRDHIGGRIDIGCDDNEIFYKFFVRDNGIGFKSKDRDKVFHRFSRLSNKRNVSGSGLGLSIVKQIVEAHGGEVWVRSRRYRGSTFYFTLPKGSS